MPIEMNRQQDYLCLCTALTQEGDVGSGTFWPAEKTAVFQ